MTQHPPLDSEWLAMKQRHQADGMQLANSAETEKQQVQLRFFRSEAALRASQKAEEEVYWRKHLRMTPHNDTPSISERGTNAPLAKPIRSREQLACPVHPAPQDPFSRQDLAKNESLSHGFDNWDRSAATLLQQQTQQPSTPQVPTKPPEIAQSTARPAQSKREIKNRKGSLNQETPCIIDLCLSDDDNDDVVLVTAAPSRASTTGKKQGAATPDHNTIVSSSTPAPFKSNAASMTQLRTPSPSVASAIATSLGRETEALTESFKKPTLPSAASGGAGVFSRTSTLTQASKSDRAASNQLQGCVVSDVSNASTLSGRKRRVTVLSDDELSDYTPSEAPMKKLKASASSSAMPPLPFTSKKTGKVNPASPVSPTTPSRTSKNRSKSTTSKTPIPGSITAAAQVLNPPPSKRKAAIRAESRIRQLSEITEKFHTEDEIFWASNREARQKPPSPADLSTRLRSMSFTPVPTGTRSQHSCSSDVIVPADATPTVARPRSAGRNGQIRSENQVTGNARAVRSRNIDAITGDNSGED